MRREEAETCDEDDDVEDCSDEHADERVEVQPRDKQVRVVLLQVGEDRFVGYECVRDESASVSTHDVIAIEQAEESDRGLIEGGEL